MSFQEALKSLLEGKYVARSIWDATGEYCALMPGMQYIWKIMTNPNPNAGTWVQLVDDLLATDWKIIDKVQIVPVV